MSLGSCRVGEGRRDRWVFERGASEPPRVQGGKKANARPASEAAGTLLACTAFAKWLA